MMPVNYVVEDDTIAFRTAPGEKCDSIPTRRVAFEVDGTERWSRSGWSVLVQGFGHDVTNADRSHHDRLRTIDNWAPGDKSHWLAIDIRRISGRRIRSATPPTSSQYGDVDE
jgi:nitroimidazol reductase NimA-like FMN-containing flavoprotein (pyridoxamine 5'-phosphate oxidase superfamily)